MTEVKIRSQQMADESRAKAHSVELGWMLVLMVSASGDCVGLCDSGILKSKAVYGPTGSSTKQTFVW